MFINILYIHMSQTLEDRATPMLNDKVNEPISGDISPKIFNFNFHKCYDSTLDGHLEFFDILNTYATIFLDKKAKTLAWGTNIPRVETGVQLRLSTIPGVIYHVFITGQLFLGNEICLRIKNHNPVLYLNSDSIFKIGADESKSFCFRALSHQTDLIMITPVDCAMPLAPFGFTLKYLTIIPDCFMCKGYVEGGTGIAGPPGEPGPLGKPGLLIPGPAGPEGPIGLTGPQGSLGLTGPIGSVGPRGPLGLTGNPSITPGPEGFEGDQGATGFMGIIGALGDQGFLGPVGPEGMIGEANTTVGPTGPTGPTGITGPTGGTGPDGPLTTNAETGEFTVEFYRGEPDPVQIVNIQYQKLNNMVTISIPAFTAGPTGFGVPLLSTVILPVSIQPSVKNYILCTAILTTSPNPPVPTSCLLQFGPGVLFIYRDLVTSGFSAVESIFFPSQSFTFIL